MKRNHQAENNKCGGHSFLLVDEAAEYLGISKQTLYRMTSNKEISYIKIRGSLRFKKEELIEYIHAHVVPGIYKKNKKKSKPAERLPKATRTTVKPPGRQQRKKAVKSPCYSRTKKKAG